MLNVNIFKERYHSGFYDIKIEKPNPYFFKKVRNGDEQAQDMVNQINQERQVKITEYYQAKRHMHNLKFSHMLEALCNEFNWNMDEAKSAWGFTRGKKDGEKSLIERLDEVVYFFSFKRK